MPKYFIVKTGIMPEHTDKTVVMADSADAALHTMREIASMFGYTVQDIPQQITKAEAMTMKAPKIKARKRVMINMNGKPKDATPMTPDERQEVETLIDLLPDELKRQMIQYTYFLRMVEMQPKME